MVNCSRRFVFLVLLFLAFLLISAPSYADTAYTYTGNPYTDSWTTTASFIGVGPFIPWGPLIPPPGLISITLTFPTGVSLSDYASGQRIPDGWATAVDGSGYEFGRGEMVWASVSTLTSQGLPASWDFEFVQAYEQPFNELYSINGPLLVVDKSQEVSGALISHQVTPLGDLWVYPFSGGGNQGVPGVWAELTPTAIPEPLSLLLLGAGLVALTGYRLREKIASVSRGPCLYPEAEILSTLSRLNEPLQNAM